MRPKKIKRDWVVIGLRDATLDGVVVPSVYICRLALATDPNTIVTGLWRGERPTLGGVIRK